LIVSSKARSIIAGVRPCRTGHPLSELSYKIPQDHTGGARLKTHLHRRALLLVGAVLLPLDEVADDLALRRAVPRVHLLLGDRHPVLHLAVGDSVMKGQSPLNVRKDTYDRSCYSARLDEYQHVMTDSPAASFTMLSRSTRYTSPFSSTVVPAMSQTTSLMPSRGP
jgi:hypothetical protein